MATLMLAAIFVLLLAGLIAGALKLSAWLGSDARESGRRNGSGQEPPAG
jgi:hypothetical protein